MKKTTKPISSCWIDWRLFLPFTALIIVFSSLQSQAQSRIKISGAVIDKESKAPVPYVHIYTNSKQGTITDETGHFSIIINKGDSLYFSSVGFDKYRLRLKDDDNRSVYHVVIEMDSKTYQLEPVIVHAYMSFGEFKQQVLDLDIPTEKDEFSLNIPKGYQLPPEPGRGDATSLNPSVTITGPFSALYNAFSKEGKQKRKMETFRKIEADEIIIQSKYNLSIIKRVTQLADDDAKRFMEWCKFEEDYILRATDYELAVAMLKCLDEFNKVDSIR
jgi:hypothetical protein